MKIIRPYTDTDTELDMGTERFDFIWTWNAVLFNPPNYEEYELAI